MKVLPLSPDHSLRPPQYKSRVMVWFTILGHPDIKLVRVCSYIIMYIDD